MLLEWTVLTVKSAVLVTVPPPTVTLILPVVAPVGTVAVICVAESTVKVAATLLKLTAVAPVKPVPVIFTTVPTGPEVGVKDVMVAQVAATVKSAVLIACAPTGVSTLTFPVVAPEGTIAVTEVALVARVDEAFVVLNVTVPALSEASRRFVPVMVTDVPVGPHVGVNDVMVGAQVPGSATVKSVVLITVPPPTPLLVTSTFPVDTVAGASARIVVPETTVKFAALTLLNSTSSTTGLSKFVPVIVTTQPAGPLVGVNEVIVGARANAGASRPSTSKAAVTPIPAARRPMCRLNRVMAPSSLSASTSSQLWLYPQVLDVS
jgi:hypothetical protein